MSSITSILFLSALSAAAPTFNMDASFDAGFAYGSGPNRVVKEIHLGNVKPTTASASSNFLPVQTAYAAPQIQYKQSGSNSVYEIAAPQYVAPPPQQQGYQPNLYAPLLQTSVAVIPASFVASTTTTQTGTIQLGTLSATTIAPAAQFAPSSTPTSQTSSSTPTTAPSAFIASQTLPPPQTTTQLQQQLLPIQPQAQYNPVYAQPAPIYAQPPPVYAQANAPQPKYQTPPPTTSIQPAPQVPIQPTTTAVSKPVNLIPSSSTTTTCSETKAAPALISPISTSIQQPITTSSGMYIPPVPVIASTKQAGKSTKAYYTAAVIPPASLFVSSAESVRAVFVGVVAFLVMV
ncbi:hypothetical protein BJ741DRAFT_701995 [Chytriomyces cf. hyalinus JEL632]|nr:hypothetical protein BJ741DRAFT_701995 [Chytriomyces cf. hyalinus JEL632]